jgi:hypothetical protein
MRVSQFSGRTARRGILRTVFACAAIAAALASTGASANLLSNGSFEGAGSAANAAFGAGSTAITGWVVIGSASNPNANIQWIDNVNPYGTATPFGSAFIDLTGLSDSAPYAGLLAGFTTTPGTSYSVTFSLGYDNGSTIGNFGGPVSALASVVGSTLQSFTTSAAGTGNQWQSFEYDFVADSTSSVIQFFGNTGGVFIGLDNVDVEAIAAVTPPTGGTVPEPMSLALLGLGGVAAWNARRKALPMR